MSLHSLGWNKHARAIGPASDCGIKFWSRLAVFGLAVILAGGAACAGGTSQEKKDNSQAKQEKSSASRDKGDSEHASKLAVRNNAASLLADLLTQEKNVSKILIIKRNAGQFGELIKAIAKTAGQGEEEIQTLAKNDSSLDLHDIGLPPGEKAAREASAKTDEVDLILSSGKKFQFDLLLTQAQALSYGSHLAKVASANSSSQDEAREFHAIDTSLDNLYKKVVAQMRGAPAPKSQSAKLQK